MKHLGLIVAAVVVVLVLTGFISVTTHVFDGLLGKKPSTFSATVSASITNKTANLTINVTGGSAPYSYIYDFGDGTSRITTARNVAYTYKVAGTYMVSVLVRDSLDNIVEAKISVTVA